MCPFGPAHRRNGLFSFDECSNKWSYLSRNTFLWKVGFGSIFVQTSTEKHFKCNITVQTYKNQNKGYKDHCSLVFSILVFFAHYVFNSLFFTLKLYTQVKLNTTLPKCSVTVVLCTHSCEGANRVPCIRLSSL